MKLFLPCYIFSPGEQSGRPTVIDSRRKTRRPFNSPTWAVCRCAAISAVIWRLCSGWKLCRHRILRRTNAATAVIVWRQLISHHHHHHQQQQYARVRASVQWSVCWFQLTRCWRQEYVSTLDCVSRLTRINRWWVNGWLLLLSLIDSASSSSVSAFSSAPPPCLSVPLRHNIYSDCSCICTLQLFSLIFL